MESDTGGAPLRGGLAQCKLFKGCAMHGGLCEESHAFLLCQVVVHTDCIQIVQSLASDIPLGATIP